MIPKQAPGESKRDYHKRLVYWKLLDRTMPDVDYAELAEELYGQPYSNDVARRMIYGSCRTYQEEDACAAEAEIGILSGDKQKEIEMKKERQKLRDERAAYQKLLRERSRQEELNELITSAVEAGSLPCLRRERFVDVGEDNDLLVSLNDIHFGACVDNHWNQYNSSLAADMMDTYLDHIVKIGCRHGSTRCIVWANGDLINGNIHHTVALSNKENVIDQVIGVSELIACFLSELSNHFCEVAFVSVAGNHSRLDTKERSMKDERLDDLVEWYLKARLQNFDNVIVGENGYCRKLDSTMYELIVRGKKYIGVHGDYDGSKEKVQSLATMAGGDVYAVLSGHLHHNRVDSVQGIKCVMAGGFLGMDDFCVQKRIFGKQEQLVCVCDEDGIECVYDIPLAR